MRLSRSAPGRGHRLTGLLLLVPALVSCEGDATGPGKNTVGEKGGAVSLAKGAVQLSIPSGALFAEVEFTATAVPSSPFSHLIVPGSTYDVGPSGTTFGTLVTLTLSYDPENLPEGVREEELRLHQAVGNNWELALSPSVDTDAHRVSGRVARLGRFGAKGVSVATVQVSPASYTLEQGQTKALSAVGKAASGMALPGRILAWTSSEEGVATVDAQGLVRAVGVGSATIRATAEGAAGSTRINTWSCTGQSEIPATECRALVDFYDGANDQDWRYSPSWVPSPHPCEWAGVTCAGGSVSRLRLILRQLPGSIPYSLGDLSNLIELDLQSNRLSGPMPNSFGNMTRLERLNLYGNLLTGPIPSELQHLSSLTSLNISGNQLSGPIPPELGELSNLAELNLNWNLLSGPIPPELGKLSNLTNLGITRTQIAGPIPEELGHLSNLEWMILWGNELSGPIPLPVAQLGGQIQARDGGSTKCVLTPQGNTGLSIPDTQDYRDADLNGDGKICGVSIGSG